VNHYAMMPEVGGDLTGFTGETYGPFPATVGVYAHEYGHVLGLPDQYDYGYESEGTGQYSLMAGGSWGLYPRYLDYYGNSPSFLDAWSRYRLGFVNPTTVSGPGALTLRPAELYPEVYRIDVPYSGGQEYYLLENRQQIGFDQSLWRSNGGAHGLAIYHVDDVKLTERYWRPNEEENWKEFRSEGYKHYGISLIQADDQWSLEHGANQGDRGDLFPGYYGVHAFGTYTFPNTSSYYFWGGSLPKFGYSGVNLTGIQETDSKGRCARCISADFGWLDWTQPAF
jgi:immune inhibitor A